MDANCIVVYCSVLRLLFSSGRVLAHDYDDDDNDDDET